METRATSQDGGEITWIRGAAGKNLEPRKRLAGRLGFGVGIVGVGESEGPWGGWGGGASACVAFRRVRGSASVRD